SAIVDEHNTSGFGTKQNPPIVYAYTVDRPDRQAQCIAYSVDGGTTLRKYAGNPVVDSSKKWQSHDTRDPRLLWYAPGGHWVMVLNERDGHSIYTSPDLKQWTYQSHTRGFWECPDLFELPVDGNAADTRWVMLGASNTYMLGTFDGKTFTPQGTKHRFSTGSIYAAQTVTGMTDGRRVQIGWGRLSHPDMPFNGMMLLPTELRLVTTADGIRLQSFPIREVESLFTPVFEQKERTPASRTTNLVRQLPALQQPFHLHAVLHQTYATSAGIALNGQNLVDCDMNGNTINGQFYSQQDPTRLAVEVDIYVDRTSVEVFVDGGLYSYSMAREGKDAKKGLEFWGGESFVGDLRIDAIR
ncbi:MAG: glycoside hydrolase family 32 protein, partial [Bacteroidaceae bacterium]|nr:glycoside hydrolase family 32 protein [Bacteroidaceae bacterium]